MDSDVVKCFNKALVSMQESKSAIVSKQKVVEITKAAMNAVRYFKHVVFILERYMVKCRPEYKISALYVMDSILRQAKKQYMHKDVFAPRFLVNLSNTINNVLDCDSNERLKVVRIINLWQAHQIFPEEAIYSLLQHCQASGLEVNPNRVELMVKGEKADMQIYQNQNLPTSAEKQNETTQRPQFIPTTPTVASISSLPNATGNISMGSGSHKSLDERLSQFSRQKLGFARSNSITTTPKTVESGPKTPPLEDQDMRRSISEKIVQNDSETAIINCLNGAEISQLLAKIGIQMNSTEAVERMQKIFNERVKEQMDIERRRAGNIKNLLSRDFDYSDEEEEAENRVGPMASPTFINVSKEKLLNVANSLITSDPSFQQELRNLAVLPVPAKQSSLQQFKMPDFSVPPPSIPRGAAYIQQPMPLTIPHHKEEGNNEFGDRHEVLSRKRTREWSRSPKRHTSGRHEQKSHRRDDERGYGRKRSRSRSGTPRYRERERDKTKEKHEREEREQIERERRRIGLPSRLKTDHVLIASRTLWFGRVPPLSSEKDIIDAVKEAGTPEKITIVGNRGCAYVTMADRKTAYKIMDRMANKIQVQKKNIKIDWATIIGLKEESRLVDYWDTKKGYCEIPFSKLPEGNIDNLVLDAWLVTESLPSHLKDRYTNIGLKENYKVKAANLPQNIALPPMPIATPTMQMVPTIFNPAILPVQMQLAAAIASIPPPNTNTTQSMAQFPLYRTTTPQMPSTPADGFSNVGFAGFNGSGRGRGGGEFRRGGRGRGGRGGFINTGYDNRGGYRGRGGGGYRGGINIRGNENRGRGNYQRYGGSHEHHSFSSFTSSQQSEVEGNDNVIPGLVDKSQQSGLDQLRESNIAEPKDKDNAPTVPPGVDKSDAPPGLDD